MKSEVQKVGEAEFSTADAAEALSERMEALGFDYLSTITNTPRSGMFTVRWGHYVEPSESGHQWEMRTIAKIYREREEEAAAAFTAQCEGVGRCEAARQFALAAGYAGRDAEVFGKGFCGWAAKLVNPRAEGREHIFRAGRAAWGSKEGQRTWRVESVRARSFVEHIEPRPFNPGLGLIANGES